MIAFCSITWWGGNLWRMQLRQAQRLCGGEAGGWLLPLCQLAEHRWWFRLKLHLSWRESATSLSVYLLAQHVCAGFLISFKINLPCWAVAGPFSTRCALTSTGAEEAGAGFGMEGGPASLVRLPLLEVANIWLALWPSLDPFTCSVVLRSEDGVGFGAFRAPKPEPRTDDWKDAEDRNKKHWIC